MDARNRMRSRFETFILVTVWASACAIASVLAVFLGYVAVNGVPTLGPELVFGESHWGDVVFRGVPAWGGLFAAIIGTVLLVTLTSAFAVPTGIAAGVYLACYAGERLKRVVSFAVDVLSGTPSIVMGLFGFGLITVLRATVAPGARTSLLLAAFCLALLVLPYLISVTRVSIDSVPDTLKLSGPAMGLTTHQHILHVLLPAARPAILSGTILAVGRAAEDTAVILLTGVVANAGIPGGLGDKFEALPFTIYYLSSEYRSGEELNTAFGAALVLLSMTGALYLMARRLKNRWSSAL